MENRHHNEKRQGVFALTISDVKTGSWRLERPVVLKDKCIGCGICGKYCPIGIISIKDTAIIDYDYCKGCGICTTVCPKQAIEMTEEVSVNA